jgi:FdhE protein
VSSTTEQLLESLDEYVMQLASGQPDLEAALAMDAAIAREMLSSPREPRVRPIEFSRERLVDRVRNGHSLLHLAPAVVDVQYAADLFSRLVGVVYEHSDEETGEQLELLVKAATTGRIDADALFTEAFVQHRDHIWEIAAEAEVDGDLLSTLAILAIRPLLRAHAAHLTPMLEEVADGSPEGATWARGYCPICGAQPLLAELYEASPRCNLRCGMCGTSWEAPRSFCPYCETETQHPLPSPPDTEVQRLHVEVCEICKGYLKVMNTSAPIPSVLLVLEDAASEHLDIAAMEQGYYRPSGNGFFVDLADFESDEEVGIEETGDHR